MRRFPEIKEGYRLAERRAIAGWKLVRKGSRVIVFPKLGQAKSYRKNRPTEDFLIVKANGLLYRTQHKGRHKLNRRK